MDDENPPLGKPTAIPEPPMEQPAQLEGKEEDPETAPLTKKMRAASMDVSTPSAEEYSTLEVVPGTSAMILDSKPELPRALSLPTPVRKAPVDDVTVVVLGEDGALNYEDYELMAGQKPAVVELLEEAARRKEMKMKDPAVLINLPTTPSAHAYEVVQQTTGAHPDESYFTPLFSTGTGGDAAAADQVEVDNKDS